MLTKTVSLCPIRSRIFICFKRKRGNTVERSRRKGPFLVADIGGTKSDLALVAADSGVLFEHRRLYNADHKGIEEIVRDYLLQSKTAPTEACFAVAGVVNSGVVRMTNLAWEISAARLQERFALRRVVLVNDLAALAHSLFYLDHRDRSDIEMLSAGVADDDGVYAVLAPGTGLGQGYAVSSAGHRFVVGSEGGHSDFAPVDDEQIALLQWLRKTRKRVSYEILAAGPGLMLLYRYFTDACGLPRSPLVEPARCAGGDWSSAIVKAVSAQESCPICLRVVDMFLRILGAEAGNMALKLQARGGVYIGGGILPRLLGSVSFSGFMQAFFDKAPMEALLRQIPVGIIVNRQALLLGGAGFLRSDASI
ncbi:MAG: glucokinase [Deltaproteobacteria bacterium]|nr:MAG: glucokinase [Deltaproteobacteria bacterium]